MRNNRCFYFYFLGVVFVEKKKWPFVCLAVYLIGEAREGGRGAAEQGERRVEGGGGGEREIFLVLCAGWLARRAPFYAVCFCI